MSICYRKLPVTLLSLAAGLFLIACDQLGSMFVQAQFDFRGVSAFEFQEAEEKLTVSWDPVVVDGEAQVDIVYEVFIVEQADRQVAEDVSDPTTETYFSSIVAEPVDVIDYANPDFIIRNQNFHTMYWDFDAGKIYSVYVRARNLMDDEVILPESRLDFGIMANQPIFDGLDADGVSLSQDMKKLHLSWQPAIGAVGKVEYLIFDGQSFVTPIAITQQTDYTIANPILGKTYFLGVRASDSRGQDSNTKLVEFTVPDPRDRNPPEFEGLQSVDVLSDKSLHLSWVPSPSKDISNYLVYLQPNLSVPIAVTKSSSYVAAGLSPGKEYAFVVRAEDDKGNRDANQVSVSGTTLPYLVPEFDGLSTADAVAGISGLNSVRLTWMPAIFDATRSADKEGYLIFWAEQAQPIDYDFPNLILDDPLSSFYEVSGLKENTPYMFVVRAFYQDVGRNIESDLNQFGKEARTLLRVAPSFSGVGKIEMLGTKEGKGIIEVKWKAPQSNGVWTGFQVDYEPGKCPADNGIKDNLFLSEETLSILTEGADTLFQNVEGLTLGNTYRFRVRTHFPNQIDNTIIKDDNKTCRDFTPQPTPPSFQGIESIAKFGDARDLSSFELNWLPPSGDCDQIEVSLSSMAELPNFDVPVKTLDCEATGVVIDQLEPKKTHYARARARYNVAGSEPLFAGANKELSVITEIEPPKGDGLSGISFTPVQGGEDRIGLQWDLPNSQMGWNRIYVWRANANDQNLARTTLYSNAEESNGSPTVNPIAEFGKAIDWMSTAQSSEFPAVLGLWNCFLVRAVFYDGTNYSASENEKVECYKPDYISPTFSGVKEVSYLADSYKPEEGAYGWLELRFDSLPTGTIGQYRIYFSSISTQFDFTTPIGIVPFGDEVLDEDPIDEKILLKLPINQIAPGYFIVRAFTPGAPVADTNTKLSAYFNGIDADPLSSSLVTWQSEGSLAKLSFNFGALSFNSLRLIRGTELNSAGQITGAFEEAIFGESGACASAPNSPCIWDHGPLDPWEVRYYQVIGVNSGLVSKSPVFAHAKVPDGMVYVDRHLWPKEEGASYKQWETYSFAIDKYEATLKSGSLTNGSEPSNSGDGVLQSVSIGAPLTEKSWNSYKRGCDNRTNESESSGFVDASSSAHPSRRIRLQTGQEFVIASYGTPDKGGQGSCNVDGRGTPAAPDATGANDNSSCVSFFGARNMIGNQWEWTDELLDDRNFIRFYGATNPSDAETLAVPIFSETQDYADVSNFDLSTSFPVIGSRKGPWSGSEDRVWQNWGTINNMPQGEKARAALRGGNWYNGSQAGRFALDLNNGPTYRNSSVGGRCALSSPAPGNIQLKNDSDGSHARFRWRLWGSKTGMQVRLAVVKSKDDLRSWQGGSMSGDISSNAFTVDSFDECHDTSYNSRGFEISGNGSLSSGGLGLQGRCGIDMSAIAPWEERYVQLYAEYGPTGESLKSDIYVVARVPDGMVFVSADDWPDPSKHRLAAEYGESYQEPFDFAIDKYEASALGNVPNCDTEDFPCSTADFSGHLVSDGSMPLVNRNWYSYKQGCDNRTEVLGSEWADLSKSPGDPSGRRVHLATGIEWMVASFETPDSVGPQFCSTKTDFWNPGAPANGSDTQSCISRYGAINMIGNQWEWTNDLGDDGLMKRYWTTATGGFDLGLLGNWTGGGGYISDWDYDLAFPTASVSKELSFYHADHFWRNLGALSEYANKARAALRGGNWGDGSQAGRFALRLDNGPTSQYSSVGGRCALSSPALAPSP